MVNTPIPHSLKSEARKAAKILRDFSMPSAKVGPDKLIPAGLLVNSAGLAVLSVVKFGFLVTARGGSGIVIAKLDDGSWSAPSAIGIAGLGGGFEIGAEVTDFVIILNKRSAVEAFSKGGNLTLGGNFTIAAGPIGRNVEGNVSVRSPAAIYTYSKTKGLFAGISVEGSYLIERKDANKKFYGEGIRAYNILSGEVRPPESCFELYEVLQKHQDMLMRVLKSHATAYVKKQAEEMTWDYSAEVDSYHSHKSTSGDGNAEPRSKAAKSGGLMGRVKNLTSSKSKTKKENRTPSRDYTMDDSSEEEEPPSRSMSRSWSNTNPPVAPPAKNRKPSVEPTEDEWDKPVKARAIFAYTAQMPCDLSFQPGDEIIVLTRTDTQEDWWEGRVVSQAGAGGGTPGIFPANYVQLL